MNSNTDWHDISLPVHTYRRAVGATEICEHQVSCPKQAAQKAQGHEAGQKGPRPILLSNHHVPTGRSRTPCGSSLLQSGKEEDKMRLGHPCQLGLQSDGPHLGTQNPAEGPHWQNLRWFEQKNKDNNVLWPKYPNESSRVATVCILNVPQGPCVKGLEPTVVLPGGGGAFTRWDLLGKSLQGCPQRGARDWSLLSLSHFLPWGEWFCSTTCSHNVLPQAKSNGANQSQTKTFETFLFTSW